MPVQGNETEGQAAAQGLWGPPGAPLGSWVPTHHTQGCPGFHLRITHQAGRLLPEKCPRLSSCSQQSSHWQDQSLLIPVSGILLPDERRWPALCRSGRGQGALLCRSLGRRAPASRGLGPVCQKRLSSCWSSSMFLVLGIWVSRAEGRHGCTPSSKRRPRPQEGIFQVDVASRKNVHQQAECAVLAAGQETRSE